MSATTATCPCCRGYGFVPTEHYPKPKPMVNEPGFFTNRSHYRNHPDWHLPIAQRNPNWRPWHSEIDVLRRAKALWDVEADAITMLVRQGMVFG